MKRNNKINNSHAQEYNSRGAYVSRRVLPMSLSQSLLLGGFVRVKDGKVG